MNFSGRFILEGAVYALEQCGLLLNDAAFLFEKGSFASSLALAAFGREELGRSRILVKLEGEAEQGVVITAERVKQSCDDHVKKQEFGQLSITQAADADSALSKLHQAVLKHPAETEERKKAAAELEEITRRQEKRAPSDRHQERLSALYVEPSDGDWSRPSKVSKEGAHKFLSDAINDYRLMLYGDPDSKLNKFLAEWSGSPVMPQPPELR